MVIISKLQRAKLCKFSLSSTSFAKNLSKNCQIIWFWLVCVHCCNSKHFEEVKRHERIIKDQTYPK